LGVQLYLQYVERQHGFNILAWSPLQGAVIANLGMAVNKKWCFRDRDLPWPWLLTLGNIQKLPHSAVNWCVFALLLQVLPFWGATIAGAGIVGIGSYAATDWFVGKTSIYLWLLRKLAIVSSIAAISLLTPPKPETA